MVDRAIFTPALMWAYGVTPGHGVTYDPNGLLLLLPTFATVLFGALPLKCCAVRTHFGNNAALLQSSARRSGCWFLASRLGLSSTGSFRPVVSPCSQPDFQCSRLPHCFTSSMFRGWTLARIFGTNAIFSFAISTVITTLLSVIHIHFGGKLAALHTALYERFFASASAPRLSPLLHAIAFVLLNAALVYPLYRRKIVLRL